MGEEYKDPKSLALVGLEREIRGIEWELRDEPSGRYKGIRKRSEDVGDLRELRDSWGMSRWRGR